METTRPENFYNDGFGWICRHCENELKPVQENLLDPSRLLREGEAESKQPKFSTFAMAKWANAEQKVLICPRCGRMEQIDND